MHWIRRKTKTGQTENAGNEKKSRGARWSGVIFFGAWGLTAILLIPMLMQVRALILYSALAVINNDTLRPPGWNTSTMVGVDKCTLLVLIAAWMIGVFFAEGQIREAVAKGRFWADVGIMWLGVVGVWAGSAIMLYVAS